MRSHDLCCSSLPTFTFHHCSDYGGWPENNSEIPMAFMTKQHRETIRQFCTRNPVNAVFPDLPTSRNGEEEEKSDDDEAFEGDEKWDLIEVIAVKELKKKKPKRCQEEDCTSGMSMCHVALILYSSCFVDSQRCCYSCSDQRRVVSGHPMLLQTMSGTVVLTACKSKLMLSCVSTLVCISQTNLCISSL